MRIPRYILDSLDLLNRRDKEQIKRNLRVLDELEEDLPRSRHRFVKLIKKNLFLFRGSARYRIIFEIVGNEITVLDIVHHDKVILAIRKRGKEE